MSASESQKSSVSRRRLLGTTGVGVVGGVVGSLGLVGPANAHQTEVPESWDMEADVVILGSGGAGTTAAIEAARAGASVMVIEKASNPGGNTAHSGGVIYLGGGTPLQIEHGFNETPDALYTYLEAQMGPTQDQERLQFFCDNAVEHYDWLSEAGVTFGPEYWPGKVVQPAAADGGLYFSDNAANSPFSEMTEPTPHGHMMRGAGAAVYKALHDTATTLDIEWHFNTAGEQLIVDASGRVIGVTIRTGIVDPSTADVNATPADATPEAGSRTLNVKANRGVVLATGGFQFNTEMLEDHAPWYLGGFGLGGPHLGDDGSGIKMGAAVGADAFNLSFASPWNFIYAPGEVCKGVLVDGRGARFVAESRYGADVGDAVFRLTDGIGWLIMDQTILEQSIEAGAFLGEPVASADSLEGLAEQLGLNSDILINTMEFYNSHAVNGEDPLLLKHEEYLQPLETAPFVAFNYGVSKGIPFITLGGLRANMQAQILNVYGDEIAGLYGSGRVAPGLSQEYYVSGSALADCTFWGRVSGREAAAATPWE